MKRVLLPFFSCLLVFTLLLGSFGSAKAEVGDDPVVTPVSGDMEFTTEIVPIVSLPGTIELADLMLAPAGFPVGEAQFEGAGVLVKGMDSGKATACFTLSTIAVNQGWGGKVGVWNGTKWVQLPTTVTTPEESSTSSACATITGSGTYAFIKYVVDPGKLPGPRVCSNSAIYFLDFDVDYNPGNDSFLYFNAVVLEHLPAAPVGSSIQYQILGSDPAGIVLNGLIGYGVVLFSNPNSGLTLVLAPGMLVPPYNPVAIQFDPDAPYFEYVTVRISFPDCYFDFQFTDDMFFANMEP